MPFLTGVNKAIYKMTSKKTCNILKDVKYSCVLRYCHKNIINESYFAWVFFRALLSYLSSIPLLVVLLVVTIFRFMSFVPFILLLIHCLVFLFILYCLFLIFVGILLFLFQCLLLGLLFYFVFCHLCTHVVCLHAEIYHTPLNFAFLMFGICSNFLTREIDVIVFFKISLWSIFLFWIWTAKLHLCSCKFLVLTNNDTNKCKFFNISWFEKGICLCLTQMLSLMTCGS